MATVESLDGTKVSLDKRLGKSSRWDYGLAHLKRTWRAESGAVVYDRPTLEKLLLMWREPALELALAYKFVPVINARRRWQCADREKAAFFKALFDPVMEKMILHMLTAFVCRYAGFSFRYKSGDPGMTGWGQPGVAPIVFDDVTVLSPSTISVEYDQDADRFEGINQGTEFIPAIYCLWYTHAAYRVFGNLYGWSDIEPAARSWFTKYLAYALFDRHVEDRVIPPVEIGYPSRMPDGSTRITDPDTAETMGLGDLARAIGEDIRSGEVVAMPTDRWESPSTGEQTGDPLWHIKYHEIPDSIDSLERVFRVADAEMFRSVHVAPAILLRMGEGWQSGRSVDSLVQVLYDATMSDVKEVDTNINVVAERLDDWNYPPDSPPCRMKTVGLSTKDQEALRNLAVVLANRPGGGGLDDVIDAARFWEELGVPIREEGYPRVEAGGPEEGFEARAVSLDHGLMETDKPGEKVAAKFKLLPVVVRDTVRLMDDHLRDFQLNLSERKVGLVEEITDEEWANAETTMLTFAAGRQILYAPADLQALERQMTPVQRLVFYRSYWDAGDWGDMAEQLHQDNLAVAQSSLQDLGQKLWGKDFTREVELTDPALLAEIRALSWDAASSVALTHNVEMARQVLKIGREAPRANRFVYAHRLKIWEAGRSAWKSAQIALREGVRTLQNVLGRFLSRNEGIEGQFEVVPETWAIPECKFDCQGAILGSPYPMSEWESIGPFPLHPNCPHHKELIQDTLSGVPDQEGAWLG